MSVEEFKLGDLPLEIFDESFAELRSYFTAFVSDRRLIGSGTFVRLNGVRGILTARHVWDAVKRFSKENPHIGILISEKSHMHTIHIDYLLQSVDLPRKTESFGPDIEFIRLPSANLGTIAAIKSFYNLDFKRSEKLEAAKSRYGVCIVMGAPAEKTIHHPENSNREVRTTIYVSGMILQRSSPIKKNGFDYWDLRTLSTEGGKVESFGGVSGGGIWRAELAKKPGSVFGSAKIKRLTLAGVAFYQSRLRHGYRKLRAHGPESIYQKLPRLTRKLARRNSS